MEVGVSFPNFHNAEIGQIERKGIRYKDRRGQGVGAGRASAAYDFTWMWEQLELTDKRG
jgi:hypothetical protein